MSAPAPRVYVCFNGDRLVLPLLPEKPVVWLAQEASQRYVRLVKRRQGEDTPVDGTILELRLPGMRHASLDWDDLIGSVIRDGEDVYAILRTPHAATPARLESDVPDADVAGTSGNAEELLQSEQAQRTATTSVRSASMQFDLNETAEERIKRAANTESSRASKPKKRRKKYRGFEEAREFVRSLNLKTKGQYEAWRSQEGRPGDIPGNPYKTYLDRGWISWPDFLGTSKGKLARQRRASDASAAAGTAASGGMTAVAIATASGGATAVSQVSGVPLHVRLCACACAVQNIPSSYPGNGSHASCNVQNKRERVVKQAHVGSDSSKGLSHKDPDTH